MATEPTRPLRLARSMRLRQGRDFQRIKGEGKRVVQGCLIANWVELSTGASSRLGVITSKKLGGAVERNRARRLLRESFRLHQHELRQPVEIVLVARNSIVGRDLAGVEQDYLAALRRARLLEEVK